MMIPNKFNGYSRDGLRRYNDPVSAGLVATGTSALGGGAAVATGLGALETGLAAGSLLAGGGGLLGELGLSAMGAPALGGLSGAATPAIAAEIAPAALAQATGTLAPSVAQSAGLDALKQQALQGGLPQITPAGPSIELVPNKIVEAVAQPGGVANTMELPTNRFGSWLRPEQVAQENMVYLNQPVAQPLGTTYGTQVLPDGRVLSSSMPPSLPPSAPPFTSPIAQSSPYFKDIAGKIASTPVESAVPVAETTSGAGNLANQMQAAQLKSAGAAALPADTAAMSGVQPGQSWMQNLGNLIQNPSWQGAKDYAKEHPYATAAGAYGLYKAMQSKYDTPEASPGLIRPYTYERTQRPEAYARPTSDTSERLYFNDRYTALEPYEAPGPEYRKASGGLASLAVGGPIEEMAAMNAVGANTGYPMANLQTPMYANPAMQRPEATNVIAPSVDAGVGTYSGEQRFAKGGETETEGEYKYSYDPKTMQFTQLSAPVIKTPIVGQYGNQMGYDVSPVENPGSKISGGLSAPAMGPMQMQQAAPVNIPAYQTPEQQLGLGGFYDYMNKQLGGYAGYAAGGISNLGDYSDGGRLLKGPGDGVSDSIPASIGGHQPARLADGEFVVPARIVSELGNGSTEAGARKLYAMMERVQKARKKSVGKNKVAVNSKADKHLPA